MQNIFDFDDLADWGPRLTTRLSDIVPDQAAYNLRRLRVQYIQDSADVLMHAVKGREDQLFDQIEGWLQEQTVVAYHGTRLFPDELALIRQQGLLPTTLETRVSRIRRVLEVNKITVDTIYFNAKLDEFMRRHSGGVRLDQVHLTMSRGGLTDDFNHYLQFGAEFDQRFFQVLLDLHDPDLMRTGTEPYLLRFAIPGTDAMQALRHWCDRYSTERPMSLTRAIIQAWSFSYSHPDLDAGSLHMDLGLVLRRTVANHWLAEAIQTGH